MFIVYNENFYKVLIIFSNIAIFINLYTEYLKEIDRKLKIKKVKLK